MTSCLTMRNAWRVSHLTARPTRSSARSFTPTASLRRKRSGGTATRCPMSHPSRLHTSTYVIVELIRQGKKVGVAANSHKAVHNLLDKIDEMAGQRGITFKGVKKSSGEDSTYEGQFIHSEDKKENISLDAQLLAGTAWLFADERFDRHVDYLFIDEAGQVALANVIAIPSSR